MRLYKCKICGTLNVDAFSAIYCCVLEKNGNYVDNDQDIIEGDIITVLDYPFYITPCDYAWAYKTISTESGLLKSYPYFIVTAIYKDIELEKTRYYLTTSMSEYPRHMSINGTYKLSKINPETVSEKILKVSKRHKLPWKK